MIQEFFQYILAWSSANPVWAGFIVFLISLVESLAVIGLIVPGTPVMFAIGYAMGTGALPFWQTMGWAIFGAVVGDGVSYWLGYHFHEHLRDFWPFRQFPNMLKRGETFFKDHGGKSIVLGRFGPIRPIIPVIAGMLDMKPLRFFFFNVFSAFIWAAAYTLPGVLVGVSLGSLSSEVANRAIVIILSLVLALWIIYMFLRTIGAWLRKLIQKCLHLLWTKISNYYPWLHWAFKTHQGTEEGQLGLAILFFFFTGIFILIVIDIHIGIGFAALNEPVYQVLRALYNQKAINIFAVLTELGNPAVLLPTATAIGLVLFWRKNNLAAKCWLLVIFLGYATGEVIKIIANVPRPEGLAILSDPYSFPSGHVLTATLVFGLILSLLRSSTAHAYRWLLWLVTLSLIFIVGFSRLYLGFHWFTDVLGAMCLGTAWIALGTFLYRRFESKSKGKAPAKYLPIAAILVPGIIVLGISFTIYTVKKYPYTQQKLIRHWPSIKLNESAWWKGHDKTYELYRTGAFKRQATLFDIQWLGSLSYIKSLLVQSGWQVLPELDLKNGAQVLAKNPSPKIFPVMPKFHRDRLPILIVAKQLTANKRLVLQLWQSDYISPKKVNLWVGTLRLEQENHPLPLITLYLESPHHEEILNQLTQTIRGNGAIKTNIINYYLDNYLKDMTLAHPVLLIQSP